MVEQFLEHPAKRRRLSSLRQDYQASTEADIDIDQDPFMKSGSERMKEDDDQSIAVSSSSKFASQTIAPFLAKHIPEQYAPQGARGEQASKSTRKDPNTKYCYRHHPDLKCRRQANEPSMEQLQHELQLLSQADQQGIAHVWTLFSAAPSKHRKLMLQGILSQCCFPQLSFLSTKVRDLIKIDFMSALPSEIGFQILRYLDTTSLCKAAQVSRRWRVMADDDVVWHKMCEQHIARKCKKCGWGLPLLERKRLMASKQHIQMRALGKANVDPTATTPMSEAPSPFENGNIEVTGSSSQDSHAGSNGHKEAPIEDISNSMQRFRPWKDVYKDRFKVGSNWKHGRYSTKIFKGHTNGVMCLQFDDQILATGSYDATIKIWDVETGKEIRTLRGHTCGVRSLQFDGNKLISGSLDKTIRVWNWRTGECVRVLTGHSAGVISLHFAGAILASGSIDNTIRIWNFEDASTTVLRGHSDWVNAVRIDTSSRTLFSASDDLTVKLWDLDTKRPIKTYKGHVGHVQQVVPLPAEFELEDGEPDVHESSDDSASTHSFSGQVLSSNDVNAFGPNFISPQSHAERALPPRYMLTSALDCNIRLWDVHTGKCLRTFFGHVEGVWALAADALRVVSGAEDRMVKVWDARSGKCERTFTGHEGPVTCIGLSDSRMCTGSEDGEIRMMSFKSDKEEELKLIATAHMGRK